MKADPTVVRRISGTAAVVLLVGLSYVAIVMRSTPADVYEVQAVLGRAGSGLAAGGDVKVRGVTVGQVTEVVTTVEDGAVATLQLRADPPLPADVRPVVTPKTFLGEKQLELHTEGPLSPPYLAAGDVIANQPGDDLVEVGTVVAGLAELFESIDPDTLAVFVDAAGAFDLEDAERFRDAIDANAELIALLDRTGDRQVERLGQAAGALDVLADLAPELTALSRALPGAVDPLVAAQADLRATSEAIVAFAAELGGFLEVEEPTIRALLHTGERIGAVVDPRMHEIGSYLHGIYRYSVTLGQQGAPLTDGSEFALFRVFLGDAGQFAELCAQLPEELVALAPGCTPEPQR